MNRNDLRFAVPPGQHLMDELVARGMDFASLKAKVPDLTTEAELVSGATAITHEIALRIGKALDMPAKVWLDLEGSYRTAIRDGTPVLNDEALEAAQTKASGGKLLLRLPASLHRRAAETAKVEGISLNQLLLSYIAEGIGRAEGR